MYQQQEIGFNQKHDDTAKDVYKLKERKMEGDTSIIRAVIKDTGECIRISLKDIEFTKR